MRGTELRIRSARSSQRITPADAGNSGLEMGTPIPIKDHPRGCGEQWTYQRMMRRRWGSPPRMRGTAESRRVPVGEQRITPADAGNSHMPPVCCGLTADHPRGCGEQFRVFYRRDFAPGSPPRMRGTEKLYKPRGLCSRITPADAGNRVL